MNDLSQQHESLMPATRAGRKLLQANMKRGYGVDPDNRDYRGLRDTICAIEAEAAATAHNLTSTYDVKLYVDRLARALCHREHITGMWWCRRHKVMAEDIAREVVA